MEDVKYESVEMVGDEAEMTARLVASYAHPSDFMLSYIEVKRGNETWHLLRRFTWFKAVNDSMDNPPLPFPSGWFLNTEPEEQNESLQRLLTWWCQSPYIQMSSVQSFFTPVRRVRLINESAGYFKMFSGQVPFIDPVSPGDIYQPLWDGQSVEPLADPALKLTDIHYIPNEKAELENLRKGMSIIDDKLNYRQSANPLNDLFTSGYQV
eukprot:TRINITY_DN9453_c0_g1_i1.p1 TRINITY_DN9453_c0_g1~~TRINITY_DN9453_c0_g1_i1.p1  ORF type:complete len:219 (-),score=26.48 TRINITY_DN9453_c0_g1_i1:146-772(-)